MSPLTRVALEALEDPATAPGLKHVACMTLLTALTDGVEVPPGTAMRVWRWLLASGCSAHALHTQELPSPEVARDALRILTSDPDAGDDARDLATGVLHGQNLAAVTDADLVLLAERVADEGRTRRFFFVVEGVHELRGLPQDFLRTLRDRLALSSAPAARATSAEIGALLSRVDEEFTTKMLADPSPVVRRTVLELLERVEAPDRRRAAAIVRRHLGAEQHGSVIAAGLTTLGSLVRREHRGEN